jgi:acetyl esterase/lipase
MAGINTPRRLIPIHIPERDISPPTSVSPAAQNVLSEFASSPAIEYPKTGDLDGWRLAVEERERRWENWTAATLATCDCRIETRDMGGVTVYVATPRLPEASSDDRAYLYIHGGAFVFGAGQFTMAFGALTATRLGVTTFAVDYRMPPDSPFPAAPEDCVTVYRELIKNYDASRVVIGGSSSGGNIAAATILMLRDREVALPAAAALLTPAVDLTESGDSLQTNKMLDVILKRGIPECIALYACGQDLRTPYVSPLFGDFERGFPPTFIQTGTRDLFLSNSVLLHRKLRRAGICADLHVWEGMPHGGFGFDPGLPENDEVNDELRQFIEKHCPSSRGGRP